MTDKIEMTIKLQVTPAQGLMLQSMFNHCNLLSSWGSSRYVSFYADGDGNFHPKAEVTFNSKMPECMDYIHEKSIVKNDNGNVTFDSDILAWMLTATKFKET